MDPRPYLICAAIFANLGNTATMLGDSPNITIKALLRRYSGAIQALLTLYSGAINTHTHTGDSPNIIIGNMLDDYLDFNAFVLTLGPGVVLSSIPCLYFLKHYFEDHVSAAIHAQ
jgi:Na+/H+ antiporter NhaD/arsenite permease-like protein